jgi:uncharacterized protein
MARAVSQGSPDKSKAERIVGRFVLKVKELESGVSSHRFDLSADWLRTELSGVEGIGVADEGGRLSIATTKHGTEVLVRGTVMAALTATCVRCLGDFALQIEAEVSVLMLPAQAPRRPGPARDDDDDEADEADEDELGVERYQGEVIELDGLIRDSILLDIPMNPVCGATCPGWDGLAGGEGDKGARG